MRALRLFGCQPFCLPASTPQYDLSPQRQLPNREHLSPSTHSSNCLKWRLDHGQQIGAHSYHGLPDHQFWKRAVAMPAMSEADPVVEARFRLTRTDRIATAGSCFAQHIARTIVSSDFNYFVSEKAPAGTSPDLAEARQFGLFSARFGNIYTIFGNWYSCSNAPTVVSDRRTTIGWASMVA